MCTMHPLLPQTYKLLTDLQKVHINPILYGSQGVALYVGPFKQFSDVDMLVPDVYLDGDAWISFIKTLDRIGYQLADEHEHEFSNVENHHIGFARESLLLSDGILTSLDQILTQTVSGLSVRTLSPNDFKKAYEFSKTDGYRKDSRGKNDQNIINVLNEYLKKPPSY